MSSTDARLIKLDFVPGFNRESTQYAEEGKWFDGNRVRFREGKPENIRGYEKFSTDVISGFPRETITWTDNQTRPYIAIGTNTNLYTVQNETLYDSTPVVSIVSVAGNFQTFTTKAEVKVSVTNTTVQVADRIVFTSVDTIGGNIDINGVRAVTSVSGVSHFYVSVATSAASNSTDAGTTGSMLFLLPSEESNSIQGLGYGAGVYNAGVSVSGARAWNEAASEGGFTFLASMWGLDTWGEDLLAQRRGGRLFYLDISASSAPGRAIEVTASPTATTFLVSPNDRHVICYGAREFATSVGGGANPMLVRWSDQEDFTEWTPAITNTSGEVVLTEGARIIGAIRSRNAINIWTDKAMYTQQFVGPPFIFSFTQVGSNCGLIGQHAAINYDGVSFWMGENNFYMYDGRVQVMPCTIRRQLFGNFNGSQKEKVYAGINSEFKEIIWLYPTANSTEPNAYVIYNVEERTWVYGNLFADGIVTTYNDRDIYSNTITTGKTSATADMYIYNNEPQDIYTGEGNPLSSFIETAYFDLDEGKQLLFADRIIPDFSFTAGETIDISLNTKDYPNSTERTKGPFTISQNTTKVDMRTRGRQASVRLSATNTGGWRWGALRLSVQPDGDR
jgi:hypothetical protein